MMFHHYSYNLMLMVVTDCRENERPAEKFLNS